MTAIILTPNARRVSRKDGSALTRPNELGQGLIFVRGATGVNPYSLRDSDLDTVSAALDEHILRMDVAKTLPRAALATSGAEGK